MKVLLEIDEDEYIQRVMCNTQIGNLLKRGKPINDHVTVTNGDVLKALFPNLSFNAILSKMYASCGQGLLDWWNAPYI